MAYPVAQPSLVLVVGPFIAKKKSSSEFRLRSVPTLYHRRGAERDVSVLRQFVLDPIAADASVCCVRCLFIIWPVGGGRDRRQHGGTSLAHAPPWLRSDLLQLQSATLLSSKAFRVQVRSCLPNPFTFHLILVNFVHARDGNAIDQEN